MALNGWPLMALAIALVVLAPTATCVLWSRLRGPRPVRLTARLCMILSCQLAALLVGGLIVNNQFQLYNSWNDLLGRDGGAGQVLPAGDGHQAQPESGGPTVVNTGKVQFGHWSNELVATLVGKESGAVGDVYVWLPPQYDQPAYANYDFPVIELFQGYPGSPRGWFSQLNITHELIDEMDRGLAKPFILVAPDINLAKKNADCSNIPNGPQVATFLAVDVRNLITDNFRVSLDRADWGTLGYSEGATCAMKLPLQYPDAYSAAVSLAGDTYVDGPLLQHAGRAAMQTNSPDDIVAHLTRFPDFSLLMAATAHDGATLAEAERMQRAVRAPMTVEVLAKQYGGHNPGVWRSWLPDSLTFLSEKLIGPAPEPAAGPGGGKAALPPALLPGQPRSAVTANGSQSSAKRPTTAVRG